MRRLLCRLGLHSWKPPSSWITFTNAAGEKVVRGVEKCRRRDCRAVRDYYRSWSPRGVRP